MLVNWSIDLIFYYVAVPALLPYKPHGSSKLFYIPQAGPELSPGDSDTTVESSHSGMSQRTVQLLDYRTLHNIISLYGMWPKLLFWLYGYLTNK